MSQMLPEGGAGVMRRGEVCPLQLLDLPLSPQPLTRDVAQRSENKELLRQQLLSCNKERRSNEKSPEPNKQKQTRNRQRNRWKLKFHHQALPQEYLDHYEQSLQKANTKHVKPKPVKLQHEQNTDISNEDAFRLWAQRLAGIKNEAGVIPNITPAVFTMAAKAEKRIKDNTTSSKVMTYEDLPYMGEMTLNNSKPRRGRKPKKADICHLIYENYGTIVPGQPPPVSVDRATVYPSMRTQNAGNTPKTDLQNKIISNLLERKMSQESKRKLDTTSPQRFSSPDERMPEAPITVAGPLHSDEEPLNLCIRDLHELKIQIQQKFGNIYSSLPEVKSEPNFEDKSETENSKNEQPNAISVIQKNIHFSSQTANSSPDLSHQTRDVSPTLSEPVRPTLSPDNAGKLAGYVYWPNTGIYMHPLALQTQLLYYQRLAATEQMALAQNYEQISTPGNDEKLRNQSPLITENKNKLVLKEISELLDPKVIKKAEETKSIPDVSKVKRSSPIPAQGPAKRKRSAIFIPPVPAKSNATTPKTEVSICKFKFTGGLKPSLQEKKMLSVDSGGNFRYYSGTNKGTKGYEYMQRDPQNVPETVESSALKHETQSSKLCREELTKKKRKSRKSLQREKLEQTFKEKGFLIQTQQLQSAEGATYCKFRQLRKFTRYLFRSWKDYLPEELSDKPNEEKVEKSTTSEGPSTLEWR